MEYPTLAELFSQEVEDKEAKQDVLEIVGNDYSVLFETNQPNIGEITHELY